MWEKLEHDCGGLFKITDYEISTLIRDCLDKLAVENGKLECIRHSGLNALEPVGSEECSCKNLDDFLPMCEDVFNTTSNICFNAYFEYNPVQIWIKRACYEIVTVELFDCFNNHKKPIRTKRIAMVDLRFWELYVYFEEFGKIMSYGYSDDLSDYMVNHNTDDWDVIVGLMKNNFENEKSVRFVIHYENSATDMSVKIRRKKNPVWKKPL